MCADYITRLKNNPQTTKITCTSVEPKIAGKKLGKTSEKIESLFKNFSFKLGFNIIGL